jgi:uncharacterized protein (DUF433 family)
MSVMFESSTPLSTLYPYVIRQAGVCEGRPFVAGTRVPVSQIVLEYDFIGWTAEDIVEAHPGLTTAQVQDALAYYYDHPAEILEELEAGQALQNIMEQLHARR